MKIVEERERHNKKKGEDMHSDDVTNKINKGQPKG
jgi:hypothetical protein